MNGERAHVQAGRLKVGTALYAVGAVSLLLVVLQAVSFLGLFLLAGEEGELSKAFRKAWRDSFGTDVSDAVAQALPIGVHSPDVVGYVEGNGFSCHRSELSDRRLWTCQRRAWTLKWYGPARERWALEFECDAPHCTIRKHYAEVR